MSLAIHSAINAALTASQVAGTLYDDLSGRIHAAQLPADAEYPALRYAVVSGATQLRLTTDRDDHQVQFDLYGHDAAVLVTALGKLKTLLHRQVITHSGRSWRAMQMDPGRRMDEPDIRRVLTTYQMREIT